MSTIQNAAWVGHRRKEQRLRKVSEYMVGQGSVLLLQPLQLFLCLVSDLAGQHTCQRVTHIVNRYQVDLTYK